jgi:hypothetical protein
MQHDRFAREIMVILALSRTARSRRLMRNPFGRHPITALLNFKVVESRTCKY